MQLKILSPEQLAQAEHLRRTLPRGKASWRKIAKLMGVTERSLLMKFNPSFRAYVEARRDLIRSKAHQGERALAIKVPDEVIADRERRQQLASELWNPFNDPIPGYSALDKKRNAQPSA